MPTNWFAHCGKRLQSAAKFSKNSRIRTIIKKIVRNKTEKTLIMEILALLGYISNIVSVKNRTKGD